MNRRVLTAIYAAGVDKNPANPGGAIDFATNAGGRRAAKQGIVLLRNKAPCCRVEDGQVDCGHRRLCRRRRAVGRRFVTGQGEGGAAVTIPLMATASGR
jgi:beta-glucosidase